MIEIRGWAGHEGYRIVAEFEDNGWSGADLDRPDLDALREFVALGGADIVAVNKRDRVARGWRVLRLREEEFEESGARLVALNVQVEAGHVGCGGAGRSGPEERYGVFWYGQRRIKTFKERENGTIRKRRRYEKRDESPGPHRHPGPGLRLGAGPSGPQRRQGQPPHAGLAR